MRTIQIEGKQYILKGRYGQVTKLLKKYDIMKIHEWKNEKLYENFIVECTWRLIKPNKIFKPFVFFYRFKKMVDVEELAEGLANVFGILYGLSGVKPIDDEEIQEKKSLSA